MTSRFIGGFESSQSKANVPFVSRASVGTYFDQNGVMQTAPVNQPRINYTFDNTPYPANRYSVLLNGSTDYLSVADNAALQLGAGTFTIEGWINRTSSGSASYVASKRSTSNNGWVINIGFFPYTIAFVAAGGGVNFSGNIVVPTNTWTHFAVVREGTGTNQTKIYINGQFDVAGTCSTNFAETDPLRIGSGAYTFSYFPGYISNFRVLKGTALYTANFVPTAAPFSAITNTSLLACQSNSFADRSANALTITPTGSPVISYDNPPTFPAIGSWRTPSLLIEPASTNLCLYSQSISTSTGWTTSGTAPIITLNYGIAPDGTQTATRVYLDRTVGTYSEIFQRLSLTGGVPYTLSVFAKANAGTPTISLFYNSRYSGLDNDLITLTNSWRRYSWTVLASGATGINPIVWSSLPSTSVIADISLWGAQVERGSLTSYIPTTTTTASRAADIVGPFSTGIYSTEDAQNQSVIDDQYTVQSFTTVGSTTWTAPADVTSVEVLVVAGGGGGGSANTSSIRGGGGGGAGGVIYNTSYPVTPGTTYPIVVGSGGAGGASLGSRGSPGGNSQFGDLISRGGGFGGSATTGAAGSGGDGGSGGGGGYADAASISGQSITGQGYPGGSCAAGGSSVAGASGGGAGGPGITGGTTYLSGTPSGPGLTFNITGSLVTYATGGLGGGGSGDSGGTATANTGNGGPGGGNPSGWAGGSGIVIVRYRRTATTPTRAQNPAVVVQRFTTSITAGWTAPAGVTSVEVLVVAGGGGGAELSGGGGAGGVVYNSAYAVTPGSNYTVTVGAGGTGVYNVTGSYGGNGGNSVFGTLTALGGGGGGGYNTAGRSGGSGGGAGRQNASGGAATQSSSGSGGFGNAGGICPLGVSANSNFAAGGGGAGGPGCNTVDPAYLAGDGGPGLPFTITGNLEYYAGGGGGASYNQAGVLPGKGGIGGGGTGAVISQTPAPSGAPNTGGGAGGGTGNNGVGGTGGSGVVILRYRVPYVATFQDSGSWTCPAGVTSVQALIVAGGGGAGYADGGGGGAGGLIYSSSVQVTPGVIYPVVVGQGGYGVGTSNTAAGNGQNSSFANLIAIGGGAGGTGSGSPYPGFNGGSGGGASNNSATPGTGVYGQGNPGGSGTTGAPYYPSSGGGGAGAAGGNASASVAGNGGAGLSYSISGSSVTYAGGGGGAINTAGGTAGTGGSGGGGNGGSPGSAANGTQNTGGGGGGGGNATGGSGGSGIVIIRWYGG